MLWNSSTMKILKTQLDKASKQPLYQIYFEKEVGIDDVQRSLQTHISLQSYETLAKQSGHAVCTIIISSRAVQTVMTAPFVGS